MLDLVLNYIDRSKDRSLELLKEFLSIPSVSTKPEHKPDMQRCAEWLAGHFKSAGLEPRIMPTGGHPVVVARNQHKPGRPTILFYGHYDVQPPEPLELWKSPPFQPEVRKDDEGFEAVFARGAVDDKGQVWCHIEALRGWHQHGGAPVNVIALIEGEEEIGSENLERFVAEHKAELKANLCLISDTGQFARGVPAITYGLRGLVYEEVTITGPAYDLHSGGYGGAVPNPANVLAQLIGTLHDRDGKVNIPGFYDDVDPLNAKERSLWSKLPFDEDHFREQLGLETLSGEAGQSTLQRIWARPTLDVNGITSGYQGHGAKTVIPSKASAKISMRLVPRQDPTKVRTAFELAMRARAPKNVQISFENHGLADAVIVPIDNPATRLAGQALEVGFGKPPMFIRAGGTIPVVGTIKKELGIDSLLVGFGLPDDRVHSPNEKFDLQAFHAGTRTAAALYDRLSRM